MPRRVSDAWINGHSGVADATHALVVSPSRRWNAWLNSTAATRRSSSRRWNAWLNSPRRYAAFH